MRVCIITDNEFLYNNVKSFISELDIECDFYYSSTNKAFLRCYCDCDDFKPICLKSMESSFFEKYALFFSMHSKQIFPNEMVHNHRCINIHPGFNPYNRGWFPQVFSIINKKPVGVTIHEMDSELDHGPIIYQESVDIFSYDTSFDVYNRIQQKEIDMIKRYFSSILIGNYSKNYPKKEGNINYKIDFDKLCELDLNKKASFREFIDVLRATTFDKYDNAYFYDDDKSKIYVSIKLKKEISND